MVLVNAMEDTRMVIAIIINSVSSFFITVPYHIYKASNIQKFYYLFIPVVFAAAVLTHNILIITNHFPFFGLTSMAFFMMLLFPLFRQKERVREKKSLDYKIKKLGWATFCIASFFGLFALPARFLLGNPRYFFSMYFGIFLIVYHIPGLWYCRNRLPQVSYKQSGLKLLTKRENEVAAEICNGLKYEEIANKLFISLSAVKKHTYNIYRKLGIKNNRELMLLKTKENGGI
jgi:DNA-binding CsgD family transcriptional regulator